MFCNLIGHLEKSSQIEDGILSWKAPRIVIPTKKCEAVVKLNTWRSFGIEQVQIESIRMQSIGQGLMTSLRYWSWIVNFVLKYVTL